jgi:hypothetical protein
MRVPGVLREPPGVAPARGVMRFSRFLCVFKSLTSIPDVRNGALGFENTR